MGLKPLKNSSNKSEKHITEYSVKECLKVIDVKKCIQELANKTKKQNKGQSI